MVISLRNGHSDPNSNPRCVYLYFIYHIYPKEKYTSKVRLAGFLGISILVGYLMPNPFYIGFVNA